MTAKGVFRIFLSLLFALNSLRLLAQETDPLGDLEPITASNIDRLTEIADLSDGGGGFVFWSADGQTAYYAYDVGFYQYDLGTSVNPVLIGREGIEIPPLIPLIGDLTQVITTSPDQQLAVHISPQTNDERDERKALLDVINTESGIVAAELITDSPFVFQRISADTFLPQFAESGVLHHLRDSSLYQWNPATGEETLLIERQVDGNYLSYTDIRLNPQGTYAATYGIWGTVSQATVLTFYDLRTIPPTVLYQQEFPAVDRWHSVAISPDRRFVAAGGSNGNVRVWELGSDSYREDNPPNEFGEANVVDLAYSPDGRYIAGCVNTVSIGYAFLRDAQTGEEVAAIHAAFGEGNGLSFFDSVAFHPFEDVVAFGTGTGAVVLWSVEDLVAAGEMDTSEALAVLGGEALPIVDVNFSADGTKLATASWDKTVRVWDYAARRLMFELNDFTEQVWSATFNPSGNTLATSSEDGSVIQWNLETLKPLLLEQLPFLNEYAKPWMVALAYSPDGTVLAGVNQTGDLYLWDLSSDKRVRLDAGGTIWHLEFSRDGRLLVTASWGSTAVILWGVPANE